MSGIKYLLDTNIIIGFYQHHPAILEVLQARQIRTHECAYSSITRMELLSYPAITARETQAIETLLVRMTYLAITSDIEDKTIEIRRNQQIKLPDSIIAATAQHHQLELLTLDKKLADMR
ncbi:MAG: type II toxin-antitoxin system VapC family toxin [Nitrosomonas sp.]|nr:type II toxin-antitoxin system VapC family toxin [Nitrosomonas sp.]MDP1951176.1 type II toxin-antitoxin system VapC family toxin [Nitrosomonas sp.]